MDLLVVGSLAYDDIETPEAEGTHLLGGSASHFSIAASLAGAKPGIVAVVGEDFTQADLDFLAGLPADMTGVHRAPGGSFRWGGRYSDDFTSRETLFTELGVFENFRPELSEAQSRADLLFLANIHPALQLGVLEAMTGDPFVAMDTMNLWIETTRPELETVIGRVDLLFINDEEARQLTDRRSLVQAGEAILTMGPSHCLLKTGEHGGLLFSGGGIYPFPPYPVRRVVDPTGAGDSFAGGVMGWLAAESRRDTAALRRAVATGATLGSFAVEGLGVAGLRGLARDRFVERRMAYLDLLAPPPVGRSIECS